MAKVKILLLALVLTLLSLLNSIAPANQIAAAPEEVKWSRVNIPTDGRTGNWVLAGGSDVQHLTMAIDGTLYVYANPSETGYTLFKSTDGGYNWSYTGKVEGAIVDIATASDDANTIYYANASNVYKSADAGASFITLPPNPGGAGSDNITITSIDVARLDSGYTIAVGTRDTDSLQFGGVYILDESKPYSSWLNTNIGNYDVCAVAFSPNFLADQQLVAVVTDEQDTFITTRIDDADWGKDMGDAVIAGLVTRAAAIAFPDDYDATAAGDTLFVAIDVGSDNGDVYMFSGVQAPGCSIATDLDIGSIYSLSDVDVTGLAVSGNATVATLLAGAASSAQVYISTNSGINWTRSTKEPTGQSKTYLLMAADFTSSGRVYAATSGAESAFSYTTDSGVTWNQTGLIDTDIGAIVDLAVSPSYRQDDTLFMLTFSGGAKHSLWRSLNGGDNWERVFTSTLANVDSISLVEFSPQYGDSSQVVFLAGASGGNSAIWKSKDNGQTFLCRGVPFPIDVWTVVNDNSWFIGSYDGSKGLAYRTTNSGLFYSTGVVVGSYSLKSIALSPNYEQDETILVGDTTGRVYWSGDNGTSFEPLGQQLPVGLSPTDASNISLAFAPEFSSNKAVYAASDTAVTTGSKERLYRFIIGKSTLWESIDSTLPVGGVLNQLVVSADGTLYATSSESVDAAKKEGGMERSLNPTYPLGPTFETVTRGLDDGAKLTGLWLYNNQLWSIDSQNTRLVTYVDSLTLPVSLTSPADKAPGVGTGNVSLDWKTLKGATEYQWQLDYDTDFSTVPSGFEGTTEESSAQSPALEMGTTYYWRVRATEPVLSPWSAKWSFTTSLGTAVIAPELYSPEAGVDGVSLKPVFQWSAIAGADSYELVVSTEASFFNPLIVRIGDYALPATAWQSDISLDYNTTYYWKVRARGSQSFSDWSAVGAFTTKSLLPESSSASELSTPPPSSQLSSPPSPPPAPSVAQSTLPDWVMYVGVALLLTVVLLLITILVLVAGKRRS